MKISVILLFVCVFSVFAINGDAQNAIIRLSSNQLSLAKLFDEIENQTDYLVVYSNSEVDTKQMVAFHETSGSVSRYLHEAFSDNDLNFEFENNYIVLSKKAILSAAQQPGKRITGTVTDSNGETIIGANVVEIGTANGTVTDIDGQFSLNVTENATLRVSFIGYITQEIGDLSTNEGIPLIIKLLEDTQALEEVVVVGYGSMRRKEITGSVTNVTSKDFNQGFQKTVADMLQGKVAGLTVNSGSGDVTSNAAIRLRGVTTLLNDQGPFFVIDNIPGADLSTVSPQDIESVSVLKDASAAAIYGSRSAGGVILVTTKKGSATKPTVNYNGAVGVATLANKPNLFTANQWREYVSGLDGYDPSLLDYGGNTDWFDEITRVGIQQDHNLSLAGGGANHNYRGSVSYMRRDGIVRDNQLERYNVRLQFSQFALNNKLKIDFTTVATISDTQPTYARNFVLAYNMSPVRPVKNDDGSWHESYDFDQGNPVRNQTENSREYKTVNAYVTVAANYTIIDGLDTKLFVAKSRNAEDYSEYNSKNSEAGLGNGGFAQRASNTGDKDLLEWTTTFDRQFGGHKMNILAGYSWEQDDYASHFAQNRTFITDYLNANDLASGQGLRKGDVGSSKNQSRLISFYGRATYSYMSKYNFTATLRHDGSSKFGANQKWGTFPSVSASWNLSEEDFLSSSSFINDLRLSSGWGVMGNQTGLSPYNTLELYGYGGNYYDNGAWHTGYTISQNANSNLQWEQTSMLNFGLDFGLFESRFNGRIEYYQKKTSNMLYNYPVPTPPYMYNEMMANVGDMKNTGFEISLNAIPVRTKNFSWDVALNVAHNVNEVTKLSNEIYTTERQLVGSIWWRGGGTTTHILEVGRPV
ncbi:MAG: SusC/RagA family TonB-linked outer membrane protein, partial [Dysgonamonadaceae bacterium]|nr:SusC/RagA family TonB-linked outer membrane protein [Dysgonamonadaceae bacterium]